MTYGLIVAVIVLLAWVACLKVDLHFALKMKKLHLRSFESMREAYLKSMDHHTEWVSDFYQMYTTHQTDLLKQYKALAEKHMDQASVDAANSALIAIARLKEVHLDKHIKIGAEDVES